MSTAFNTRFADLSPPAARACLAGFAALIAWSLAVDAPPPSVELAPGEGDVELYRAIIGRLQAGEGYYAAAAAELGSRGYALKPFFNFRLPTLAYALSAPFGFAAGMTLLPLLALAALVAWARRLRPDLPIAFFLAVGAMTALGAYGLGMMGTVEAPHMPMVVFHEVWSSLLIVLSLAVWSERRWWPSVLIGLAAVLVRELALPYIALMAVLALWDGHRRAALAWATAIAAFALALAVHASFAVAQVEGPAPTNGWASLGGWTFVLATARWSLPIMLLPAWAAAVLLPLALLGLAGWRGALGLRVGLLVAGYIAAFMVLGRPDNNYWGFMYGQLLIPGLVLCAPSLLDLLRRAVPLPFGAGRAGGETARA